LKSEDNILRELLKSDGSNSTFVEFASGIFCFLKTKINKN